ncbi:hypothetical protein HRR81_000655 [Exophiala dermatitidis]|nr:hypothetical protein HRR79_000656 [Exophiala dermatitidis]KAJ4584848.1 hypothetical protein HRR81_000655 [Exophiala dermatitidis]KAJ9004977.1 hypothetical protein HRR94_000655 [Exophiala dermatitidis]
MSEEHKMKTEEDGTELGRAPTVQEGDTIPRRISVQDAVFGTITNDGPNYRNARCLPWQESWHESDDASRSVG